MHLGSSDKKHISCLHLVRRFSPHLSAICKNYITKQQLCKKKKKKNVWHAHYLKKLAYSEPQLVCYRCGPVWFVFFFFFYSVAFSTSSLLSSMSASLFLIFVSSSSSYCLFIAPLAMWSNIHAAWEQLRVFLYFCSPPCLFSELLPMRAVNHWLHKPLQVSTSFSFSP